MRVGRRRSADLIEEQISPELVAEVDSAEPLPVAEAEPLVLPEVAPPTTLDVITELGSTHEQKLRQHLQQMLEEFKNSFIGKMFPDVCWNARLEVEATKYTETEVIVWDPETSIRFKIEHYKSPRANYQSVRRYRGMVPTYSFSFDHRSIDCDWYGSDEILICDGDALQKYCAFFQRASSKREKLEEELEARKR